MKKEFCFDQTRNYGNFFGTLDHCFAPSCSKHMTHFGHKKDAQSGEIISIDLTPTVSLYIFIYENCVLVLVIYPH